MESRQKRVVTKLTMIMQRNISCTHAKSINHKNFNVPISINKNLESGALQGHDASKVKQ